MRVLHLTTFLQGGAGRAITDLACEQYRAGHWVEVVTSRTAPEGYGNYPEYLDRLQSTGVDLHLVDSLFSRDVADTLHVSNYIVGRELLSGTTVVHAHAATPALAALVARGSAGRRVPIVQTMHGWGINKSDSQRRADVTIMDSVDGVVVPAAASADVLRSAGVSRHDLAVVPYGIPDVDTGGAPVDLADEFAAFRADGRAIFACVGTLGERKNQAAVIEALARLPEPSRVMCLFVGDGSAESLHAHAERLGVASSVRTLGYRRDAAAIASASDWLLLPSRSEGQPLSIIEAFRDRVPVLVSRIPELCELVQNGDAGLMFVPCNPDALATRMLDAMRMSSEQTSSLTTRARARFEAAFSLAAMVRGYAAQYARARTAMGSAGAAA